MKLILNIVSLRKSVVLIAFFSFASILYCQEKSEAQHPTNYNYNDSVKIKILNDSVWSLMFNDIQKAIPYAISSLSLSEKLKNPYSLSDTYNTLCVLYYVSSQFDSSIFYGKKSLKIRENLKDEKGLISTYNNLGSNYKELGDYKLEVTYYFKALYYARKLNDLVTIAKIYNNIGDAYERIGLYKPAINFNQKALEVYINSKDTNGIISSYINMATSYILQDEFKKAKDLFELCEKYLTNSTSNYLVAKFYANYASLQLKMEQYEDALKNIEMSINLNNQINNQNSNLVNYINYAYILENLHKYKESYHSYKDAITIAKKLGNKQWEKQAYLGLATTASKMKMFETAFDNMMNYHNLKDSILSKEIEQKYAVSTANYTNRITYLENQNLLNKNKLLAKENLMVKNKLIITILVLLNILVGGGFFTVHIVNKIKKKNQLMLQNKYEKERNQLSKDLHDELGSDLTRITLYAEIIKNNTDSEIAVKIVNTSKKINENVRDLIWFINPENNQTKDLFIQLREFIYDATSDFNIECSIKTSCITNNKHTPKQSINISRIIKEVINNILKHAHAQKIDVSLVSDKHLEIQIFDNGNGFNTNASYQGNGLRNIQFRANQIGAKISFQSEFNKGTLFTFSL